MSQTAHLCSPIGLLLKKQSYIKVLKLLKLRYWQTGFYNYENISHCITLKMDGDWNRNDPNKLYAYTNMMQ